MEGTQEVHAGNFPADNIETIFTYQKPTEGQQALYENIRNGAKAFAETIVRSTPPSADQTAALRKLRECVMTANAAVTLQGVPAVSPRIAGDNFDPVYD